MARPNLAVLLSAGFFLGMLATGAGVDLGLEGVRNAAALRDDGRGPGPTTGSNYDCLYCRGEDDCIKVELGYDDCPWSRRGDGKLICHNPDDPCNAGGGSVIAW